jgi:hypothetical protein
MTLDRMIEAANAMCGCTFADKRQGISGPMFAVLCVDPSRATWVVCADLESGEVFCLHATCGAIFERVA